MDQTQRLARESVNSDDATGWFDGLYAAAERGDAVVPWDRGEPHVLLVEWAKEHGLGGAGRRALVVGSGLGADAEYVAGLGFATVAFDVAKTAVEGARRRYPDSPVRYVTADLLDPPSEWRGTFDLVVESLTVQSLPLRLREQAIARVAEMVAPGGTLLVVATARDYDEPPPGPPWPLSRAEVESFVDRGLRPVRIESFEDPDTSRRWRAEFRRPA